MPPSGFLISCARIADQLPVRLLLLQQLLLAGNTQLRVDGTKLEQQLATVVRVSTWVTVQSSRIASPLGRCT